MENQLDALRKEYDLKSSTDCEDFEVVDYWDFDPYLLLAVKYPSCDNCAWEGTKLLVYGGVRPVDVMRWKKIDPHFREPQTQHLFKEAPPPLARFPGSEAGRQMAMRYCAWLKDPK